MERIFKRLPCLTDTGIHTVINGPITYSADGAPLVGPVPGLPNALPVLDCGLESEREEDWARFWHKSLFMVNANGCLVSGPASFHELGDN